MKRLRLVLVAAATLGLALYIACHSGVSENVGDGGTSPPPPPCTNGTDKDGDGYGPGCPAGDDCNDNDPSIHPGAVETCDGKDNNCNGKVDESGGKNACGTCDSNCNTTGGGNTPFPIDPSKDPNVKDANGVKLDPNGDIILDNSAVNFNYMWIANTYDIAGSGACGKSKPTNPALCRGSISKVDTVNMKEVGRYYTVTCSAKTGATGCVDVNGKPITLNHNHTPSRTAVDFNFDVWVANRSVHGGQPSATKIANDPGDCIDRNKNGKIDTSKDQDGDGKINIDCNGDGVQDTAATVCTNGKPPEFLGDDDECILFTTNYANANDLGRSICLDSEKANVGASNAWVGTFSRPENGRGNNRFYGINGNTGAIMTEVEMPAGHHTYGCMADANHIIWATDIGADNQWFGSLAFFSTLNPYPVGPLMRGPTAQNPWKDASNDYRHYGISINADQHVWLGGWTSAWVLRYKPNRTSFDTLSKGTWTRIDVPAGFTTRGIAADSRGKIWVSINDGGYILRLEQSIGDGVHNMKSMKDYWPTKADTVIGSGVDFSGNLWGVGHSNNTQSLGRSVGVASRLDVDAAGNVVQPPTAQTKFVPIGANPYTYSDFTGFGLINFVRAQGRYVYQLKACSDGVKATWSAVAWNATTPQGTAVLVRVRTGDSDTTFGQWSQSFPTSPALFGPKSSSPIAPNPATYMQVEFTLKNSNKQGTPILHDYSVSFICANAPG